MNKRQLAEILYELGLIKIGSFKLSSGKQSPFYIDLRRLIEYPQLLKKIARALFERAKSRYEFDVVAGVATGGIPIAAYISCLFEIPMAYIRKKEKKYGTEKIIEGDVKNKRVLLVDDVVTTGASLEHAAKAIRESYGQINYALVIVDREQGGKDRLNKINVILDSLITAREIFEVLFQEGKIEGKIFEKIMKYLTTT